MAVIFSVLLLLSVDFDLNLSVCDHQNSLSVFLLFNCIASIETGELLFGTQFSRPHYGLFPVCPSMCPSVCPVLASKIKGIEKRKLA